MATEENMTKRIHYPAIGLILLLVTGIASGAQLLDRVIAVVGQDVIMLSELRGKAQETLAELQRANTNPMPSRDQVLSRSLDALILEKVQLAEAERLGIEADQELVAKAITRIAGNNNMSVAQLRQALAAEGQDFRQFQANIRDQIIISRLINTEVTNKIQISKSEVDQYLLRQDAAPKDRAMVNLLHILIATPDGASAKQISEAKQRAEQARARIEGGVDFRAVAQDVSDGAYAIEGGDLGWREIASLPGALSSLVNQMQVGDTYGPVRSDAGFHIIQVEGFSDTETPRRIVRQTEARHILIRTDEITADSDARERLTQLRDRILQGDDFGTLARSHSDDQASAIKGGELGWISPGKMVPEFEEQLGLTPVGEISKPFKTRFGWHIVQVTDKRESDQTDQARRNAARAALRERKSKEATEQYLRRLRDEAYIDLRLVGEG